MDKGVDVGNRITILEMRRFKAKVHCLAVDSFDCRGLVVDLFVNLTLSVQGILQTRADAGWYGGSTLAFTSVLLVARTIVFDKLVFDAL